jgi:arsenate reductase (glutaredoxin)
MSQVEILHNPRCSKSRQTLELLTNNGVDVKITEYLKTPPSTKEIKEISIKLGLKPSQFVRRGEYKKLGFAIADTEEGIIKQMEEYPILIERPIVINADRAKIGRPPESVLLIL